MVMKRLKVYFILFYYLNCASETSNMDCIDCGGGLLDGYLYKEVTLQDITKLNEIAITTEIGNCIRFKMDDENFESAEIVEDCCCNLFN